MRFDIAGKSLWYGTPDAPAPQGAVTAGAVSAADGVTVIVGVQPLNASNRVEVHYRVNGHAPAKIPAILFRTDIRLGAQYFSARLPHLRVGDKVDYGAVCDCGNVQIPQPAPPHVFQSSFHVVEADHRHATLAAHTAAHIPVHHQAATSAQAAHVGAQPASGPPPHTTGRSGHGSHSVEGIVSSPGRGPIAGVLVEIIDKNPGPHHSLATATTDDKGHYHASYTPPPHKSKPDICARVFAGQTLLGVSVVHYNASAKEKLGVTIPAGAEGLPSEYDTLTAALARGHAGRLAELKESGHREDITYLAKKTGWDARAIIFAAVADRLAHERGGGALQPAFYYALFRAGFSMEPDALYGATAASVTEAWKQAIQHSVIPKALAGSIDAAAKAFQSQSAKHALEEKPVIGLSTLKEILEVTLGNDTHRQQMFANLHVRDKDDLTSFWTSIEAAFGPELTKRLQLDGQLAHLTLNNAPLLAALHKTLAKPPLASVEDLVFHGFYNASKWAPLIGSAVPKEIVDDTIAHRRSKYADYLSAQVRLASPTAVVADMVANGGLALSPTATAADKAGVHALLKEHSGRFSLGGEPVERFLAHNLSATYSPRVIAEIKRLQRVYQIAPNDHAFAALLHHGLDSAYAVTRYDPAGFARAFGHDLGGDAIAHQVHAKASVVAAAVLQIATSRLAARGSHAAVAALRPTTSGQAHDGPVITSPTMEQLFSSMDFCDCPECRSILSPAAYLVDLLNFIDYPPAGKKNPQKVLLDRRPDLQYLPLTCENTNVALPYIDLVNETLEYFVTNELTLVNFRGHTTDGSVASEELLASPQFVQESAYAALKSALFPLPLPFDRSLELVRLHSQAIGVPLHAVMMALHDAKARDHGVAGDGWNDILMERVGLSRNEHRLLTDGSLTLRQIYGFPAVERAPIAMHPVSPQTAKPSPDLTSPHGLPHAVLQGPLHPQTLGIAHTMAHGEDNAVIAELSNFQNYCRRVGVSYDEMDAIVQTRFINPSVGIAARVRALGVSFEVIQALKAGMVTDKDFLEALPAGLDPVAYGAHRGAHKHDYGPILHWVKDELNYGRIMALITIARAPDSDGVCSAATLRLCYANPDPAHHELRAVDFVRLLRFVRLWRKLGITIHQTDAIISALYPVKMTLGGVDAASDLKHLDAGFSVLLSRVGFLLQVLELLSLSLERDLSALLACWAPIVADGRKSLYAKMFLSESLLRQDPVFAEDSSGNVLQAATNLLDHEPALRSALHLTATEFAVISDNLGFSVATPLNLDNVSAIYRRGWLARSLRMSVVELLALAQCTGLDPFAPLDLEEAVSGTGADQSVRHRRAPPTVQFIRLVHALRDASVKPTQALYLLWNRDISAKSAPDDSIVNGLARALRANAAAVESQFALVDDPNGSIAKTLMALVYGTDDTDFFFSRLDGSLIVSTPYAQPGPTLPDSVVSASQGRLAYDELRKLLTFAGVLDDATTLSAMTSAAEGNDALRAALNALSKANRREVDPFFASHAGLKSVYMDYVASTDPPQVKRKALLSAILSVLKPLRKEEQAIATITAAAGVDQSFASVLLRDVNVLASAAQATTTPITDFTALGNPGLSARFFLSNDSTGKVDITIDAAGALSYAHGTANTLPAGNDGGPIAGIWSGFVDAPKSGFYDIAVATDPGGSVSLKVNGAAVTMALGSDGWTNQTQLEFHAGALVPIQMIATGLRNIFSVRWATTGVAWQSIPPSCLYSATLLDRLRASYVRFLKAASLGTALSLTANEVAYLAANQDVRIAGQPWLNHLVVKGVADATSGVALTEVLVGALDFARMKAALSATDESLLAVVKDPTLTLPGDSSLDVDDRRHTGAAVDDQRDPRRSALLALTKWDQASLSTLLIHFFGDPALTHLSRIENFRRVYDAYAVVTTCGISAGALIKTAINNPTPTDAGNLRSALRAQYADADWLTLIKPINDKMRTLQRDALVAYVLSHFSDRPSTRAINTPDRLFDYLLMDVEMAACGQTSRIRLALSSIQLFIERALRGYEPDVDPIHISADQWEWMKRYRIWQANREVFLWPENWLDPELREDQSPLFKEATGALLQGDISEDAAESALLGYLAKLHEVAKLEPCGLYHVPGHPAADDSVTHVIARTAGSKRKYFYRRQEHGSWTRWEEIKLAIEDNPVVPLLWNDRLLLLWLQIIKQQPPPVTNSDNSDSPPPRPQELKFEEFIHWGKADWAEWRASVDRYIAYEKTHGKQPEPTKLTEANVGDLHRAAKSSAGELSIKVQAVLCWSEYHDGKWLSANTSDVSTPTELGEFPPHGHGAFDRSRLHLRAVVRPDGALLVHLAMDSRLGAPGAGFLLFNTHSLPLEIAGIHAEMLHAGAGERHASYASSALRVDYKGAASFTRDILHTQIGGRVVESQPGLPDAWEAPFLYEDSRNVFYVTSEELHEPLAASRRFGFAHPSGVGHGGTTHHFPALVTPHQSPLAHLAASTTATVRYNGVLFGAAGRVTTVPAHAGSGR